MAALDLVFRESGPDDVKPLIALYPDAFPDEDLVPLVRALMGSEEPVLSLVACLDDAVVGHIVFTRCLVSQSPVSVALLGPLAVAPQWHKRGIGSALVHDGFERLAKAGVGYVYVLGDPAYYQRFGFTEERSVVPPYALPVDWQGAWQSVSLQGGGAKADKTPTGSLIVPQVWQQPALWAPETT